MSTKEQLSKEYTGWLHKEVEEYYGQRCDPKDMYFRNGDISLAFEAGWDAALKNQWISVNDRLPNNGEYVFILVKGESDSPIPLLSLYDGEKFLILSKHFKVIAWMRIPQYVEIL